MKKKTTAIGSKIATNPSGITVRIMGGQSSQSFGHLVELKMRVNMGEICLCILEYSNYFKLREKGT